MAQPWPADAGEARGDPGAGALAGCLFDEGFQFLYVQAHDQVPGYLPVALT